MVNRGTDALARLAGFGLLDRWMRAVGIRQADLAAHLGVTQQTVSKWQRRHGRPGTVRIRAALEIVSAGAVPAASWLTRRERQPLRARPLRKVA